MQDPVGVKRVDPTADGRTKQQVRIGTVGYVARSCGQSRELQASQLVGRSDVGSDRARAIAKELTARDTEQSASIADCIQVSIDPCDTPNKTARGDTDASRGSGRRGHRRTKDRHFVAIDPALDGRESWEARGVDRLNDSRCDGRRRIAGQKVHADTSTTDRAVGLLIDRDSTIDQRREAAYQRSRKIQPVAFKANFDSQGNRIGQCTSELGIVHAGLIIDGSNTWSRNRRGPGGDLINHTVDGELIPIAENAVREIHRIEIQLQFRSSVELDDHGLVGRQTERHGIAVVDQRSDRVGDRLGRFGHGKSRRCCACGRIGLNKSAFGDIGTGSEDQVGSLIDRNVELIVQCRIADTSPGVWIESIQDVIKVAHPTVGRCEVSRAVAIGNQETEFGFGTRLIADIHNRVGFRIERGCRVRQFPCNRETSNGEVKRPLNTRRGGPWIDQYVVEQVVARGFEPTQIPVGSDEGVLHQLGSNSHIVWKLTGKGVGDIVLGPQCRCGADIQRHITQAVFDPRLHVQERRSQRRNGRTELIATDPVFDNEPAARNRQDAQVRRAERVAQSVRQDRRHLGAIGHRQVVSASGQFNWSDVRI